MPIFLSIIKEAQMLLISTKINIQLSRNSMKLSALIVGPQYIGGLSYWKQTFNITRLVSQRHPSLHGQKMLQPSIIDILEELGMPSMEYSSCILDGATTVTAAVLTVMDHIQIKAS